MSGEIVLYSPAMSVEDMLEIIKQRDEFIDKALEQDTHWGTVPGVDKPFLWKSGAEKLNQYFGYYVGDDDVICLEEIKDWDRGFFYFKYRVRIRSKKTGEVVAMCDGAHSSFETKYRYRWCFANQVPEGIDTFTLKTRTLKSKKDGKEYTQYRVENEDRADLVNTLIKMSIKSAYVGATLMATGSSDRFTLDEEDVEAQQEKEGKKPAQQTDTGYITEGEVIGVRGLFKKQYEDLYPTPKDRAGVFYPFLEKHFGTKKAEEIPKSHLKYVRWLIEKKIWGGNAIDIAIKRNYEKERLIDMTTKELDDLMTSIPELKE